MPFLDRLDRGKAFKVRFLQWDASDRGLKSAARVRCRLVQDDLGTPLPERDAITLKTWLLTPDTDFGQKQAMQFNDLAFASRCYPFFWQSLTMIDIVEVTPRIDGCDLVIQGDRTHLERIGFVPKEDRAQVFLLQRRHVDATLKSSLDQLRAIDERSASPFLDMMADPNAWGTSSSAPLALPRATLDSYKLSPSQMCAWDLFRDRRLLCIWGPAGSGKTHSIALLFLCFVASLRAATSGGNGKASARPIIVLITGFTITAIANAQERMLKLLSLAPDEENLEFVRLTANKDMSAHSDGDTEAAGGRAEPSHAALGQ